jgi:hypothetical protein
MFFRGQQDVGHFDSTHGFQGMHFTPTEFAEVKFTVSASAPEDFTFKLLSKDLCDSMGTMAPIDEIFGTPMEMLTCTSNGMTVSFKAADASTTTIDDNGTPITTNGNDVMVKKNGITADTAITCSYYIKGDHCTYSASKVYFHYSAQDQSMVTPSYYSHQPIYVETQAGASVNLPSIKTIAVRCCC